MTEAEEKERKLEPFRELEREGRKISWEERSALIKRQFPSVERLNWEKALTHDMELFGAIMRDVLRYDQAVPGRDGPKPEVGYKPGMKRLRQFMGDDHSLKGFPEAFKNLAQGMSLTTLARKTSMSRMNCSRLLRGEKEPDIDEMVLVAKAFKKHPSYFREYRNGYILSFLVRQLESSPETGVSIYRKLSKQAQEE